MTSLTFATYLAPIMRPVYQWITDRVGTTLDCETRLVVGSSYGELTKGEVDAAFLCGWPYVRLADDPSSSVELLAAPVLAGSEHGRWSDYCSRVIVRADSPYRSFADLRGCSWSFNEPASYSGYLATLDHLRLAGAGRAFFARMVEAGWHEESIRLVRAGEIDASAIDCQVLDVAMSQDRSLASAVRVLSSFRTAPIQPVVVGGHVPERVRSAVRRALLDAAADPEGKQRLAAGQVERFVRIDDRSYDVIRERARAAAAAGLL
ncbi:MAG: PhnD/SsuA/transferrin family substrate-binding protein [Candidatus Dormibacteraeota bacterium]|nr:PhnD/SsuA/transferrin family substrate-binding protein [Candidatus Dormibacteraeota bacterium]